jgi:hypothetical protein
MANVKITELTELAAVDLAENDVLPIVDVGSDATKKVTIVSLRTFANANDYATYTSITANLNIVQDNVATVALSGTNFGTYANTTLDTKANVSATYLQLNANLDIVQDNVAALSTSSAGVETRRAANVTIQDTATTAVETRRAANVTIQDTATTAVETRRAANVTIQDTATTAVETRRAANSFYTYNTHSVVSTANIIPSTNNILSLGAPNAVYKDVYVGPGTIYIGTVRLSDTDGALTITSADDSSSIVDTQTSNVTAALNVVQDNVAAVVTEATAVETRRAANIAGAVSTITTGNLTVDRALVSDGAGKVAASTITTTVLGYLDATSSVQTQLNSKIATTDSASNDYITYTAALANDYVTYTALDTATVAVETRRAANVTIQDTATTAVETRRAANVTIQDTATTAVETRRAANIAGAISTVTTDNLSTARALVSDESGKIAASSVTTVTLGYLDATSSIQNQLNTKAPLADPTFTGLVTASHDLVVSGNLTVNGETTTINSANKVIQDRFIMLANAVSGAPSGDVGIFLNRGTSGNAAIYYDESAKSFTLSETRDPDTNVTIHPTGAANLVVGAFSASTVSFNGVDLNTAITDNVTSLATADTALETRRTANIAGAVSTITTGNLTVDRTLVSDGSGKVAASTITTTVLGYLDATSSVQTQIDSKQASLAGATLDLGVLS